MQGTDNYQTPPSPSSQEGVPKNTSLKLFEVLLFLFLLCAVSLGLLVSPDILSQQSFCLFQRLTGFDCPGCGLTRAFLLIPRGRWALAFDLNPAAFLIYLLFLFLIVKIILQRIHVRFVDRRVAKGVECGLWALALVVLLGQWMGRIYVVVTGNI